MSFIEQELTAGMSSDAVSEISLVLGATDVIVLDDGPARIETSPSYEASSSYKVQTESFEGPFDLLLHLILKEEVELYDINLSEIVDAYLVEIERMDLCDLETATEFLLIAATLVELKVRRLMPIDDDFDLDAELGLWEERDLLLARLLECKTFKDAAKTINWMIDIAALVVPRRAGLEEQFLDIAPDLLAGLTGEKLRRAFLRVATAKPPLPEVSLAHVTDVKASVSDALEKLVNELPGAGRVSFRTITKGLTERIHVVVNFLAVLELYKQGYIEIEQQQAFGDMTIEWMGEEGSAEMAMSGSDIYEG